MFCKYCGTKLVDNAAFCQECGKSTVEQPVAPAQPVPTVQVVYQQPAPPAYQQPAIQPKADPETVVKLEQQALTFGILGLSLSMLGVPGIVFSSIAGGKAAEYKKYTGALTGKALTGYRLAKAGKIVSIVMTVLLSIFLPALLEGNLDFGYSDPFEHFSF